MSYLVDNLVRLVTFETTAERDDLTKFLTSLLGSQPQSDCKIGSSISSTNSQEEPTRKKTKIKQCSEICTGSKVKEKIENKFEQRESVENDRYNFDRDSLLASLCIVRRSWNIQILKNYPSHRLSICFKIVAFQRLSRESFSQVLKISDLAATEFALRRNNGIPLSELCFHALATAANIYPHTTPALQSFLSRCDFLASAQIEQEQEPLTQMSTIRARLLVYNCFKMCQVGCVQTKQTRMQSWSVLIFLISIWIQMSITFQ
jgi:hypothetical protein